MKQERMPLNEAMKEAKAIQGMSEEKARQEKRDRPSSEDYTFFSELLDKLKAIRPDIGDFFVSVAGEGKDLKDEYIKEVYNVFMNASEKIIAKLKDVYTVNSENDLESFFQEYERQIMSDEEIIQAFKNNQEALPRILKFTKESLEKMRTLSL
jgi:predicted  nucleic acid-binding Zn-ribbon protein